MVSSDYYHFYDFLMLIWQHMRSQGKEPGKSDGLFRLFLALITILLLLQLSISSGQSCKLIIPLGQDVYKYINIDLGATFFSTCGSFPPINASVKSLDYPGDI